MAFDNLTIDQLQARFVADGVKLAALEDERTAILKELKTRKTAAKADQILRSLNPDQRDALRLALEQSS